ncbi:hypothetical protein HR45_03695 [Shewanella mangrovi]|uniref:Uncharacterized protein n=1 Tax=Shewanella mangrovi TaxID=1515746 RepID=A0A094JF33_9GAMM|nr:DUF6136 family protein [Shewanella mangrovi]KFZ38540.1 hypothetical protein HR45_03695 [Shewanella mangrovi]
MNYWQFRYRIYRTFLHTWRESLQQISIALVALFPLAIQALPFLALVALGILADPSTEPRQYFITLWGYQLLLHSWVLLQRDGITAATYQPYLNSLPISRRKHRLIELRLMVYAANLLLLAPLAFWGYLAAIHEDQLLRVNADVWLNFLPLTALVVLSGYYSWIAVYRRYPWLSLLLMPLLLLPASSNLSIATILAIWLLALALEQTMGSPVRRVMTSLKQRGIRPAAGRLNRIFYFKADKQGWFTQLLRLVALLLLLIISDSFISQVSREVQSAVANTFCFFIAILLASKLIELQKLHETYHYYLAALPQSKKRRTMSAIVYLWLYSGIAFALIAWFQLFSLHNWALLLLFFSSAQIGILLNRRYFLAVPVIVALLLWLTSAS